jgi:hypothetical protein
MAMGFNNSESKRIDLVVRGGIGCVAQPGFQAWSIEFLDLAHDVHAASWASRIVVITELTGGQFATPFTPTDVVMTV